MGTRLPAPSEDVATKHHVHYRCQFDGELPRRLKENVPRWKLAGERVRRRSSEVISSRELLQKFERRPRLTESPRKTAITLRRRALGDKMRRRKVISHEPGDRIDQRIRSSKALQETLCQRHTLGLVVR